MENFIEIQAGGMECVEIFGGRINWGKNEKDPIF